MRDLYYDDFKSLEFKKTSTISVVYLIKKLSKPSYQKVSALLKESFYFNIFYEIYI